MEHESFRQSVERLGGARRIDKALDVLADALSRRPEGFELVGNFGLRVATTTAIPDEPGDDIPPLRLFFQIGDRGEVILWWIEEVPEDEIPF